MDSLRRFAQFCRDTWAELKKTTWPGRSEVYGTTIVVVIAVLITAVFLFFVDMILSRSMEFILEWFS